MRLSAMLLVMLLALPGPADAQEPGLARPVNGKVEEGFDPNARVAGSRIVGVRIGAAGRAAFDPAGVEIVQGSPDRTICVRAISRDGLYWMRTPYLTERTGPTLKLAPFTDAMDRLRKYSADEIAIYAFESEDQDCLDAAPDGKEVVLPAIAPLRDRDTLEVLINSGNRRVTALLVSEGATPIGMDCAPPASRERVTYDRVCILAGNALKSRAGILDLHLTFDDGLMQFKDEYKIRLSGAAR